MRCSCPTRQRQTEPGIPTPLLSGPFSSLRSDFVLLNLTLGDATASQRRFFPKRSLKAHLWLLFNRTALFLSVCRTELLFPHIIVVSLFSIQCKSSGSSNSHPLRLIHCPEEVWETLIEKHAHTGRGDQAGTPITCIPIATAALGVTKPRGHRSLSQFRFTTQNRRPFSDMSLVVPHAPSLLQLRNGTRSHLTQQRWRKGINAPMCQTPTEKSQKCARMKCNLGSGNVEIISAEG